MRDYKQPKVYAHRNEIDYPLVLTSIAALYAVSWALVRAWGML